MTDLLLTYRGLLLNPPKIKGIKYTYNLIHAFIMRTKSKHSNILKRFVLYPICTEDTFFCSRKPDPLRPDRTP